MMKLVINERVEENVMDTLLVMIGIYVVNFERDRVIVWDNCFVNDLNTETIEEVVMLCDRLENNVAITSNEDDNVMDWDRELKYVFIIDGIADMLIDNDSLIIDIFQ